MAADDVVGYLAEAPIVTPGVPPERLEGLVHIQTGSFAQDALGLLDDHSAVEGKLQLVGARVGFTDGPVAEEVSAGVDVKIVSERQ
jgi:hypothetical protein